MTRTIAVVGLGHMGRSALAILLVRGLDVLLSQFPSSALYEAMTQLTNRSSTRLT